MRCAKQLVTMLAVLLISSSAVAGKVGFVEVERASLSVQEGKAKVKVLEEWSKPREERLRKLQDRVMELRQELVRKGDVATKEAIERLQEAELEARRRLEDATRDYKRDLDVKQSGSLGEIGRRINQIVTEYAGANGYDAVFIFKERTLIYLSESANLTDVIIKLYDEKFPVKNEQ